MHQVCRTLHLENPPVVVVKSSSIARSSQVFPISELGTEMAEPVTVEQPSDGIDQAIPTKKFTVPAIIRTWVSLMLVYFVRTWSKTRRLTVPKEVLLYLVVFTVAYVVDTFIWPTRIEMGREESDLVQEYLRHRKEGETIGQYLIRLEREEEESIKLHEEMLFKKGKRQTKRYKKNG